MISFNEMTDATESTSIMQKHIMLSSTCFTEKKTNIILFFLPKIQKKNKNNNT